MNLLTSKEMMTRLKISRSTLMRRTRDCEHSPYKKQLFMTEHEDCITAQNCGTSSWNTELESITKRFMESSQFETGA